MNKVIKVVARKAKVDGESDATSQLISWGKNDENKTLILNPLSKKL